MITIPGWIALGIASVSDIRSKTIPRRLIIAAACWSAAAQIALYCTRGGSLFPAVAAMAPGAAMLLLSFLSHEAVGYGDGLLLTAVGPLFGWKIMTCSIPTAFLMAALCAAVLMACRKADRKTKLPFVPFLTAAMGVMTCAL